MKIHWGLNKTHREQTVVDWAMKSPDLISPSENAFICGQLDFHKKGQ